MWVGYEKYLRAEATGFVAESVKWSWVGRAWFWPARDTITRMTSSSEIPLLLMPAYQRRSLRGHNQ